MKNKYIQPMSFSFEIDNIEVIATSVTGNGEGLGFGGASTNSAGEDVGADAKSRIDFSEEIELPW